MALLMAFNGEKPSPNGATCKEVRSPGRTKERQQRWREEDSQEMLSRFIGTAMEISWLLLGHAMLYNCLPLPQFPKGVP